ncbi:MAG: hypothetical protein R2750_02715 [Bacteroidales bacterium]
MKKCLIILAAILPIISFAQDEKKFGIKFSGFVKTDLFFDTHESVNVREGHFLLYPLNEKLDPEGNDLYASTKFNFLSIQTRLRAIISGPDALGAKTSGVVEGEFFGTSNADINGFRLRHAFVKLNWAKTELLVGQNWHPMFNTNCFPGTVSFNTGAPFEPFSRNPQIRVTQKLGKFSLALTALSQRGFTSTGPAGPSTIYSRESGVPAANLTFDFKTKNEETGKEYLAGASINFKTIQPTIVSDSGFQTNTNIASFGTTVFFKYACHFFTVKLHNFYGGDATNLTMLGGYAVKEVTNIEKAFVEYTPIMNNSSWIDIHTNGKNWQYGLFGGYSKNLGAVDEIKGAIYARGLDTKAREYVDYVYRMSGRVIFNAGNFRVAPELEYTVAAYAQPDEYGMIQIDPKGKVTKSKEIGNFRLLIGVYYFF